LQLPEVFTRRFPDHPQAKGEPRFEAEPRVISGDTAGN